MIDDGLILCTSGLCSSDAALRRNQLQQRRVDGERVDVYRDRRLIEGALFSVQARETALAYCVAAA